MGGVEGLHDENCDKWCNHCEICGTGILYGSRCLDDPNTDGWSGAYRDAWFTEREV